MTRAVKGWVGSTNRMISIIHNTWQVYGADMRWVEGKFLYLNFINNCIK